MATQTTLTADPKPSEKPEDRWWQGLTPRGLFLDQGFYKIPRESRRLLLQKVSPSFASASNDDQESTLDEAFEHWELYYKGKDEAAIKAAAPPPKPSWWKAAGMPEYLTQKLPKALAAPFVTEPQAAQAAGREKPAWWQPPSAGIIERKRTALKPEKEKQFQDWYAQWSAKAGLDPDPDNPLHKYDYRGAFNSGLQPEISEDGLYHWPSQFKDDDHPNRFVAGIDTKTGKPAPPAAAYPPGTPTIGVPTPGERISMERALKEPIGKGAERTEIGRIKEGLPRMLFTPLGDEILHFSNLNQEAFETEVKAGMDPTIAGVKYAALQLINSLSSPFMLFTGGILKAIPGSGMLGRSVRGVIKGGFGASMLAGTVSSSREAIQSYKDVQEAKTDEERAMAKARLAANITLALGDAAFTGLGTLGFLEDASKLGKMIGAWRNRIREIGPREMTPPPIIREELPQPGERRALAAPPIPGPTAEPIDVEFERVPPEALRPGAERALPPAPIPGLRPPPERAGLAAPPERLALPPGPTVGLPGGALMETGAVIPGVPGGLPPFREFPRREAIAPSPAPRMAPPPEIPSTVGLQTRFFMAGTKPFMMFPEGSPVPKRPLGVIQLEVKSPSGQKQTWWVRSKADEPVVRKKVANNTWHDLLGLYEQEGPRATATMTVIDPETDIEIYRARVRPENIRKQASQLRRQFPGTKITAQPGPESPPQVIEERIGLPAPPAEEAPRIAEAAPERRRLIPPPPSPDTPSHIAEGMSNDDLASMNLRYNGWQEGFADIPGGHLYTRTSEPRTTFMVGDKETIAEAHQRVLEPFKEKPADIEKEFAATMIAEEGAPPFAAPERAGAPIPKIIKISAKPGGMKAFEIPLEELGERHDRIMRNSGYLPETAKFDWLDELRIPHTVIQPKGYGIWEGPEPNLRIHLGPEVSVDTADEVAALFGEGWAQDGVAVDHPNSKIQTWKGIAVGKPDASVFTVDEINRLAATGVAFETNADGTRLLFNKYWPGQDSYARDMLQALTEANIPIEGVGVYTGDSHLVERSTGQFGRAIESLRNKAISTGRPGLPDRILDQLRAAFAKEYPDYAAAVEARERGYDIVTRDAEAIDRLARQAPRDIGRGYVPEEPRPGYYPGGLAPGEGGRPGLEGPLPEGARYPAALPRPGAEPGGGQPRAALEQLGLPGIPSPPIIRLTRPPRLTAPPIEWGRVEEFPLLKPGQTPAGLQAANKIRDSAGFPVEGRTYKVLDRDGIFGAIIRDIISNPATPAWAAKINSSFVALRSGFVEKYPGEGFELPIYGGDEVNPIEMANNYNGKLLYGEGGPDVIFVNRMCSLEHAFKQQREGFYPIDKIPAALARQIAVTSVHELLHKKIRRSEPLAVEEERALSMHGPTFDALFGKALRDLQPVLDKVTGELEAFFSENDYQNIKDVLGDYENWYATVRQYFSGGESNAIPPEFMDPEILSFQERELGKLPRPPPRYPSTELIKKPLFSPEEIEAGPLVVDIARALGNYTAKHYEILAPPGRMPMPPAQEAKMVRRFVDHAGTEVLHQIAKDNSAADWYREDVARMEELLPSLDPSLSEAENQRLFKAFLTIMSPGNDPHGNIQAALKAYGSYSANNRIPTLNPDTPSGSWGAYGAVAYTSPLRSLQNLLDSVGGDVGKAMDWLTTKHPVSDLRKIKFATSKLGPRVFGKAEDMRYGSYIFGEKEGSFLANLNGINTELTKDRWFTRSWNRMMGSVDLVKITDREGNERWELQQDPRNRAELRIMNRAATQLGEHLKLDPPEIQALMWYYEQSLYAAHGAYAESWSYADAAERALRERGIPYEPRAIRPSEGIPADNKAASRPGPHALPRPIPAGRAEGAPGIPKELAPPPEIPLEKVAEPTFEFGANLPKRLTAPPEEIVSTEAVQRNWQQAMESIALTKPTQLGIPVGIENIYHGWIMPDGSAVNIGGSHQTSIANALNISQMAAIYHLPEIASRNGLVRFNLRRNPGGPPTMIAEFFAAPTDAQIMALREMEKYHDATMQFGLTTSPGETIAQGEGISNIRREIERAGSEFPQAPDEELRTAQAIGRARTPAGLPRPPRSGPEMRQWADEILSEPDPPSGEPILEKLRRVPKQLRQHLITRFAPLDDIEGSVYRNAGLPPPTHPLARVFELVAGAAGKADADALELKKVLEPVADEVRNFEQYVFFMRTLDRLATDPTTRAVGDATIDEVRNGLNELEREVGPDIYQQFFVAGQRYQEVMDSSLRLQVQSGRMSEGTYDYIKSMNDFYAPFHVLHQLEADTIALGGGQRFATREPLTQRIKGILRPLFHIRDLFQQSYQIMQRSRILAEKNWAILELDRLADLDPQHKYIERIKGPILVPPREHGGRPRWVIPGRGEVPPGKEILPFLKDGERWSLLADKNIADAVQGQSKETTHWGWVTWLLRKGATGLRAGATTFNIGFQPVNLFFADIPTSAILSKYGIQNPRDFFMFWGDVVRGATSAFGYNLGGRADQLYVEALKSGVINSTFQRLLRPQAFKPKLGIEPKGGVTPLQRASGVLDTVARIANAIEETTKLTTLRRGMRLENVGTMAPADRAKTMARTATEVRNYGGSPDFLRRGLSTPEVNLLWMFFNARIQGVTNMISRLSTVGEPGGHWKNFRELSMPAIIRTIGLVAAPLLAAAIYNRMPDNKEDFDKVSDNEKRNYVMIPRTGKYFTDDQGNKVREYFRLPKRDFVQAVDDIMGGFIDFFYKRDPAAFAEMSRNIVQDMSPVNIQGKTPQEVGESVISSMNPLIKGPMEFALGRDTFRHRDVVPGWMGGAPAREQYRADTPKTYIYLGKVTGISPMRIKQAADTMTGGFANQFLGIGDTVGDRPFYTTLPIAKRFVRSTFVNDEEEIKAIAAAEEADSADVIQRQRMAEIVMTRWRRDGLDLNEKLTQLDKVTDLDAVLAKTVQRKLSEESRGLTYTDRRILDLGVETGARARYLAQAIANLPTEAARNKYMSELVTKRIITGKVGAQIKEIQKGAEPIPPRATEEQVRSSLTAPPRPTAMTPPP